jgi:hypothetical protein
MRISLTAAITRCSWVMAAVAEFVLRAEIFEGKYLRVEVEDQGGPWDLGFGRDSGRWHGLDLVDEMASDWGREGDSAGWVVWFRLDWPHPWEVC